MDIFDFITQEEIDDLPEDEPRLAFMMFVRTAQRRLSERTSKLDENENSEWRVLQEARYGFVNVVVAAAKQFEIEPFASIEVPKLGDFSADEHKQFRADLDHFLTQLLLDNRSRSKRTSVLLPTEAKASIRTHLNQLRAIIDKADIADAKRATLLAKLAEFEKELEKKRLNLVAVAMLTVTVAGVPGSLAASGQVVGDLLGGIWQAVAEAKASEDEKSQLPMSESPVAITAPRPPAIEGPKKKRPRESFNQDLDDEIPF